MKRLVLRVVLAALITMGLSVTLPAKEDIPTPKEYGVYLKVGKTTKRLLPNMVLTDQGILYVESNNPARFKLGEVELFILYGKYDMKYLTLNPLLFAAETPLKKSRYLIGKDMEIDVVKKSDLLYTAKPKGLFGRGYYCLWINDTVWDFVIE